MRVLQVAVPAPLRRTFDYLPLPDKPLPPVGSRVRVTFGRRETVGMVMGHGESELQVHRLKPISSVIDADPILSEDILELIRWSASYYHYPIGEVLHVALPAALRRGEPATLAVEEVWRISASSRNLDQDQFKRAPLKSRLWKALLQDELAVADLARLSQRWRPILLGWQEQDLVECVNREPAMNAAKRTAVPAPALSPGQMEACERLAEGLCRFATYLLHGVTGSGKTEVYLDLIGRVLERERQALVLVPEIGLTPQLLYRFERRFPVAVAVLHSGLNDAERLAVWLHARSGLARIVIGTRSAIFTPFAQLGAIIVDEEHDGSYKQQDGFRYHARDLAILRARHAGIPVVLGSATPSLESIANTRQSRYQLITLPERPGAARLPAVQLLDMRRLKSYDGLSHPLLEAVRERFAGKEQSLLFLNRRGFAAVLMCHDCGWLAPCTRCDARLTLHKRNQDRTGAGRLRCHHCGADQAPPASCPSCRGENLHGIGEGTQRVESALAQQFPQARIVRIDRDNIRRKGELEARLASVHSGEADILVGTQMLSKGHDFPRVTLVGILNADQGFYGVDFRSGEQLFQQIMQVAGRAGRADKPGQVLIQTYNPDHPLFGALQQHDYNNFADFTLTERREAGYPPFAHFALLRAESPKDVVALRFLRQARDLALPLLRDGVLIMEPVPSPMERRADRYRAQLLVQAASRAPLHAMLKAWLLKIEQWKESGKVRWSLDVDPITMY